MSINYKLNLSLFLLGFIGILSLLLAPIPAQVPEDILQQFSKSTFKLLMLINPTILLLVAVLLGGSLTKKIGLDAPIIRGLLEGRSIQNQLFDQLKTGVPIGILAGLSISIFYLICEPFLPLEMIALNEEVEINVLTRFFYGGITEEILLRWGVMSLFIWIGWKIFGKNTETPTTTIIWIGIILAAILFGIGHLPMVYASLTEVSSFLIFYIISGNMILGILAGWLFWRQGLEAAIIAHLCGHIGMMTMEMIIS